MVYDMFKPDLIDINYGCPVPKVTKKGAGSAALKNLDIMLFFVFILSHYHAYPILLPSTK